MFGFGKKEKQIKQHDIVYMNTAAKYSALAAAIAQDSDVKAIAWFEGTRDELRKVLPEAQQAQVVLAAQAYYNNGTKWLFAEHYPMQQQEQDLYKLLGIEEASVYSSLDEPLFLRFGGEKITGMMRQMGMQEEEALQHALISKSIQNAQEKIAKKVLAEQRTTTASEWMELNIPER